MMIARGLWPALFARHFDAKIIEGTPYRREESLTRWTIAVAFCISLAFAGGLLYRRYVPAKPDIVKEILSGVRDILGNSPKTSNSLPATTTPQQQPTPTNNSFLQGSISVTKIEAVDLMNTNTHQKGFVLNVYYRNSGAMKIIGSVHRATIATSETPLSDDEIAKAQLATKQIDWHERERMAKGNEIEENSADLFFSTPQDDQAIVRLEDDADLVRANKKIMYVFVAFQYRDAVLPKNKGRLTELCRWAEGNFDAWHRCGMNRTTVITEGQ
jgi:hypothetical protein